MAHMVKIIGAEEIKQAMKKADRRLGFSVRQGLIKAGLFLQRESQKIVPVDLNNLKPSAGTKPIGQGWYTDVVVFYTASYAVYVHEIVYRGKQDVSGNFTNIKKVRHKKGKQAKFLESPAREKKDKILRIIAGEAEKI